MQNKIKVFSRKNRNGDSALVQIAKLTIVEDQSVKLVHAKVNNSSIKQLTRPPFVFDSFSQPELENVEIGDATFDKINKHFKIPILNNSGHDVVFNQGNIIGSIQELQEMDEGIAAFQDESEKKKPSNLRDVIKTDHLSPDCETKLFEMLETHNTKVENKQGVLKIPVKHQILLKDENPVCLASRQIPYSEREEVKKQVENLLEKAIIQPSISLYSAPIVTVRKADGSLRLCVDYRHLNSKTIPTPFPIPRLNELLDRLKGAKYFSVIDIRSAYYNIEVEENDQNKTAFVVPTRKFEFKYLPFGLIGSPFTFGQAMNFVLEGMEDFLPSYFDDILIFSSTINDHLKHLDLVLKRLGDYNLAMKLSKCQFFKYEVKFVGHIVNANGYKPETQKVSEIINFKRPSCVRELRQFLGMSGFYGKFIENYSQEVVPLCGLLKKNVPFN